MPTRMSQARRSTAKASSTAGASQETQVRRFRARLEPDHSGLQWTVVRLPAGLTDTWTRMRRLRVRGAVNGVAFRNSLFPDVSRPGMQLLLVNKQVQRAAGVRVGDEVEVELEPDLEDRPSALPPELIRAFEEDRALRRWSEALSESTRRDIGKWIGGVKGPEARCRRAAQMAERLLQAMQGEERTPPVLEVLLARSSKARKAWDGLTLIQRRGHLLGIFFYRTPEGRTRRAEKAVSEAMRAAERRERPHT